MNIKMIQAKHWLQSIAFRSKEEQHTEHADNALDELIRLEKRNRNLTNMINDKEKELIVRGSKLSKLQSEVLRLETDNNSLNEGIDALESINKNLIEQLEDKF